MRKRKYTRNLKEGCLLLILKNSIKLVIRRFRPILKDFEPGKFAENSFKYCVVRLEESSYAQKEIAKFINSVNKPITWKDVKENME